MAPTRNIYLVGFMGAGKTSVGKALARRWGWPFLDLDAEIERAEGLPVREIFKQSGEPHFRRLEREHLEMLATQSPAIIALGGGAWMDVANRRVVESTGVSVWLKVSLANVFTRVTMDGTRPLFDDPRRAESLFTERTPVYQLAQLHVSTDDRSPEEISSEIAEGIR